MALSSTVLIASSGIINGHGFTINEPMVQNMMSVMYSELNLDVGNIIALSNTLQNLQPLVANIPYVLTSANTVAQAVLARANTIILGDSVTSNKNYIYLLGKSADFITLAQQYTAAIDEMSSKEFGDFGIGVDNYTGTVTNTVSTLVPKMSGGYADFVSYVSSLSDGDPLAKLTNIDPNVVGPQILKTILTSIAEILKSIGNLLDFTNLSTFGTAINMLSSLQNLGLADSTGINAMIVNGGYNPYDYMSLTDAEVRYVFSNITGANLSKIINLASAYPIKQPETLLDLLNIDYFFSPYLQEVMGIQNSGSQGMQLVGNKLMNVGITGSASKIIAAISTMEIPYSPVLNQIPEPLPQSVVQILRPLFGNGVGVFAEPTLADILGTAAGEVHSDAFSNVYYLVSNLSVTNEGVALRTNIANVIHYVSMSNNVATDSNVAAAITGLETSISDLNSSSNVFVVDSITLGNLNLQNCLQRLTFEANNASLAGIEFITGGQPNLPGGINDLLGFSNNLQNYGADTQYVGYNYMLTRTTTSDITGESIRSALVEGRNLARSTAVGQPIYSQPNETAHRRQAANVAVVPAQSALQRATTVYDDAINAAQINKDPSRSAALNFAVSQALASLQDKQDSVRALTTLGSGSPLV
jgi:hypothetical protein